MGDRTTHRHDGDSMLSYLKERNEDWTHPVSNYPVYKKWVLGKAYDIPSWLNKE